MALLLYRKAHDLDSQLTADPAIPKSERFCPIAEIERLIKKSQVVSGQGF